MLSRTLGRQPLNVECAREPEVIAPHLGQSRGLGGQQPGSPLIANQLIEIN